MIGVVILWVCGAAVALLGARWRYGAVVLVGVVMLVTALLLSFAMVSVP